MVRRSLLAAAFVLVATPLAAQEEVVWNPDRPDGHAPLGVVADRTLGQGQVQFSYRFFQINNKGIWFDNDSLDLDTSLDFYRVAPLSLDNLTHQIEVAYGATPELTVMARIDYSTRERQQFTGDGTLFVTEADGLGDLELTGLYEFYSQEAVRAHVQLGALVPTGQDNPTAPTPFTGTDEGALPYDMRPGAGVFGVLPGMTAQIQNEMASVGAQVRGTVYFGENDLEYRPGNRFEGTLWAGYRLNSFFSVSARARFQTWSRIQGGDPNLLIFNPSDDDPPFYDPGNDGFNLGGSQLEIPVGLNLYMPSGTRFEGHRLAIEYMYPAHRSYDGPQLGLDRSVVVGYQVVF